MSVSFTRHSNTSIEHPISIQVLLLADQILASFNMLRIAALPHPTRDRRGPPRVLYAARSSGWVHEMPRINAHSMY